jgi:hypothetical protein
MIRLDVLDPSYFVGREVNVVVEAQCAGKVSVLVTRSGLRHRILLNWADE